MIRIFDRYVGRQVWSGTLMGVMVLSLVFVLGTVFKKLDQLLGDTSLPTDVVIQFIGLVVPFSLIFTIPWAFLTAILLSFGRMSADNELVSLRMTGMSMARICAPVFVIAAAMAGICFWVNLDLAPYAKNKTKRLFRDMALENPASLFQEGKVLDKFPGYRIYTGKRDGNKMQDLQIVELSSYKAGRTIWARRAELRITPGVLDFELEMRDALIESVVMPPPGAGEPTMDHISLKEFVLSFPLSRLKEKTDRVNSDMKTTGALWDEVRTGVNSATNLPLDKLGKADALTELNKRFSLSLVCIAFVLVGIPLGITAQRRETAVGFLLSLGVAVGYYSFVIFADRMSEKPDAMPHLLMWLPNVIFIGLGLVLFWRLSRR